ncbi:hypothetical protein F900_01028 [Acinetobacter modestus]|uniref:Uncharacterized protein n=1 Tax=Acinetobacter modestus TaxID=1776740 RepID=N9NIK1_9GAMM|nr:hypothetical protein [Acinetobacter modestus]ENX02582.1 hypothetical protein F900_01028 [Acinetobacter modestus]
MLNEIHKNLTKLIELKTKEYEKQSWLGFYIMSFVVFAICLYCYGFIEAILRAIGIIFCLFLLLWWLFAPLCFYITKIIYGYDPDDRIKEIREQLTKKYSYTENDGTKQLNNINRLILDEINIIHDEYQNLLKKEQEVKKRNLYTIIKYIFGVALVIGVLILIAISIEENKQHQQSTLL